MIRNYIRTSTRGSYGDDRLGRAVDAVKNRDSVNKASGSVSFCLMCRSTINDYEIWTVVILSTKKIITY